MSDCMAVSRFEADEIFSSFKIRSLAAGLLSEAMRSSGVEMPEERIPPMMADAMLPHPIKPVFIDTPILSLYLYIYRSCMVPAGSAGRFP